MEDKNRATKVSERKVDYKILNFEDRSVAAHIIFCPHDDRRDTDFILESLSSLEASNKTLFVEQGSPRVMGLVKRLEEISKRHPDIAEDLRQKETYDGKPFGERMESYPYAVASDSWISRGGEVLDMDINLSEGSINFIVENAPPEIAIELIYGEVRDFCYNGKLTIPRILKILLPFEDSVIEDASQHLWNTYHNKDKQLKRVGETHDYRNYLREAYMLNFLKKNIKEGDVIIAHPNHLERILNPSETACPIPRKLFQIAQA